MKKSSSRYDTVEVRGPKLRFIRQKARLTQARLAALASISRGYVAEIEGEAAAPVSRTVTERLATALQTSVAELTEANEEQLAIPPAPPAIRRRPSRRGFRFGAGFAVGPPSRTELLRELLRHFEEMSEIVRELLRSEEAQG